jgi:hypothetical protein
VICAYFNFLMLGYCTYYFCREILLTRPASLFAAIVAMFSGTAIVYLSNPLVNSMASFPLMLLAGEKIINGRRLIPWIAALGLAIGISILGGHPETTFHLCVAFGLYFVLRLIIRKPGLKTGLLWIAAVIGGMLIGLLIGAIQWIPFTEFLLSSATLSEGGRSMGGTQLFFSSEWRYNLTSAVTFLIPDFFGSPLTHNYLWPFPNYQNYNEQSVYFGLIPLAFAFSVLFSLRKRPQALILVVISLFFLAVAWRLPGFEIVNHIPPFSLVLNKRMKLFIPMMLAIVAGIGLNDWLKSEASEKPGYRDRLLVLFPAFLSLAIFIILGYINLYSPSLSFIPGKYRSFFDHLVYQVFNINQPRIMISLVVPVLFIILCLLLWRNILNQTMFGYCVLIVTLIELGVLAWKYNPTTDRKLIYPEIPLVSLVGQEKQPFRILSTDLSTFPPNAGAAYRIAEVEGYDLPVFRSFFDIYKAQGGDKASHRQEWSINYTLVDWLNVLYVVSPVPIQRNGYRLVLDQPSYKVYKNENAYPRAYIVYDYQVIEDQSKLLATMITNPDILKEKVLFTEPPPGASMVNDASNGEHKAEVEFLDYGMDRVILKVTSTQPGFLVMSDLYANGWKAKLDNQAIALLTANYTYRAVYVPVGQHQVEFYYQPASYSIGAILSGFGILLLLILWLVGTRKAKIRRE